MIEQGMILVFAIFTVAWSLGLLSRTSAGSKAISPALAFGLVSVVFVNVGFIILYVQNADEQWASRALMTSVAGLASCSLGAWSTGLLSRARRRWAARHPAVVALDISYPTAMRSGAIIGGFAGLYFLLLGYVPLFSGIAAFMRGGFSPGLMNTLRVGRDVYVSDQAKYIPMQGLLEAIRYFGVPIVAIWFVEFIRQRCRVKTSAVALIACLLLVMAAGQRWPLMYSLIALGLYLSWVLPAERLGPALRSIGYWSGGFGLVLTLLLGRRLAEGARPVETIRTGAVELADRIFLGNVLIPFASYRIFPDEHGYLWGQSWMQNLRAYLPGPEPSFPVTFYQLVAGDRVGFTAPPDFYTEAYINFGMVGVLILSFAWGALLTVAQYHLARRPLRVTIASSGALIVTLAALAPISGVSFVLSGLIVLLFVHGVVAVNSAAARVLAPRASQAAAYPMGLSGDKSSRAGPPGAG